MNRVVRGVFLEDDFISSSILEGVDDSRVLVSHESKEGRQPYEGFGLITCSTTCPLAWISSSLPMGCPLQ